MREEGQTDGQNGRKERRREGEKCDRGEEDCEEGARLENRRILRSEPWAGWDPPCPPVKRPRAPVVELVLPKV